MRTLVMGMSAAVLVAACGQAAVVSTSSPATATPEGSSASSSPPLSASPSAHTPTNTAPPELRGRWGSRVSGESVVLILDGDGYTVRYAGVVATGHISVVGDEIVFDSGSICEGAGRYRWTIQDERLRFEEIGDDPCGRPEVLIGTVYGNRSDP